MNVEIERTMADRQKKIRYVCSRIPREETTRIYLTQGGGGEDIYADLYPMIDDMGGCDLQIETNEPETGGLNDVYEYYRHQDMTYEEWKRWWNYRNPEKDDRAEYDAKVAALSKAQRLYYEAASETVPLRAEPLILKVGGEPGVGQSKGCLTTLVKLGLFKKDRGYLRVPRP